MLRKILGGIVIYSIIIFIIVEFGPQFDFHPFSIQPPDILRNTPLFLLIGGIFWLVYDIGRQILKWITLPFNWISLGLTNVLLNIGMLYLFAFVVNSAELGASVQMGTLLEVIILAFILGILGLFIKFL